MALKFTLERTQNFKHLGMRSGCLFYIPQESSAKRVWAWTYAQIPKEKAYQRAKMQSVLTTAVFGTGPWSPFCSLLGLGTQLGACSWGGQMGRFPAFKFTVTSKIISMLCPKDALLSDYIAFPAPFSNLAHRESPCFPYQLTKWQ